MKFLESKEISVEKDNVKLTLKPIAPLHQATLLGYQVDMNTSIQANDTGRVVYIKMQSIFYALKELVNKLEINGEIEDPIEVADCVDVSDMDNINILNIIYDLVVSVLVEGETKKKSSSPQSRTKKK